MVASQSLKSMLLTLQKFFVLILSLNTEVTARWQHSNQHVYAKGGFTWGKRGQWGKQRVARLSWQCQHKIDLLEWFVNFMHLVETTFLNMYINSITFLLHLTNWPTWQHLVCWRIRLRKACRATGYDCYCTLISR